MITRSGVRLLAALAAAFTAAAGPPSLNAQAVSDAAVDSAQVATPPDSAFVARALLAGLDTIYAEIIQNVDSIRITGGEVQALLRVENAALIDSLQLLKVSMVDELRSLRPDYPSADSIRSVFQSFLEREFALVDQGFDRQAEELDSLRALRVETPLNRLSDLEEQIGAVSARLDTTLAFVAGTLEASEAAGLQMDELWALYDRFLSARAAEQMGRLQLALTARTAAQDRITEARASNADQPELDDLELRRRVAELRIERNATSLDATADLLAARGLETAAYRQLLIQATGEVTSDVLDVNVAVGLFRDWLNRIRSWIVDAGPNLLVQFLVVAGCIILARIVFHLLWRVFVRSAGAKMSRLLSDLLERMLMPVATIVGLLAGLLVIGIDPTAFIAGVGIVSVIIGLALQDSLANLAAGAFILLYRPFDVDDTVTAGGVTGTVRAMGLASTTIVTFDNRRLFVPNNRVWGDVIENKSAEVRRRIDFRFRVAHHENLDGVVETALDVCAQYELILEEPAPLVYVASIEGSLVELEVRAWARTPDWWTATTQLPRRLAGRLRTEGVEPPYPRHIEFKLSQDTAVPFQD